MRFIPTGFHGFVDYLSGVVWMSAPWMLGFASGGAETSVMVWLGAMTLFISLYTDYEAGPVKVIPMPIHLAWDFVAGMILLVSPIVFGFAGVVWLPHVLLGAVAVMASLTTQSWPKHRQVWW